MSIMDDYKQLQMIENIKKIKEMELCYKSNLKLVKKQEQQINKLATCIEKIKEIAEKQIPYLDIDKAKTMIELEYDYAGKIYDLEQRMYKILQKISECEV